MTGSPRYIGTKTGDVVKAIAVDSLHTWRDIQSVTGFSEKELNYHLSILYNNKVLVKQGSEYYIVPELEEAYLIHFQTPPPKPVITESSVAPKGVNIPSLKIGSNILILSLILSLVANLYFFSTITSIQRENSLLQSEIETLTSSIDTLQDSLSQSETLSEELDQQIFELEAQISELETQSSESSGVS